MYVRKKEKMSITKQQQLEKEVQNQVLNACEDHPELVEQAYDDHEEYMAQLEDLKMRRSLSKRLLV